MPATTATATSTGFTTPERHVTPALSSVASSPELTDALDTYSRYPEDPGSPMSSSSDSRMSVILPWKLPTPDLPPMQFDEKGNFDPAPFLVDQQLWQPNNDSPKCRACGTTFTFTIRRHHCRTCGGLVCGRCSPRHPVTSKRCCPSCALHLTVFVFNLRNHRAFHGRLTSMETEARLINSSRGGTAPYLLRLSETNVGQLIISSMSRGEIQHAAVEGVPGALRLARFGRQDPYGNFEELMKDLHDRAVAQTPCPRPLASCDDKGVCRCPSCNRPLLDSLCVCGALCSIPSSASISKASSHTHLNADAATASSSLGGGGGDGDLINLNPEPELHSLYRDDARTHLLRPFLLSSSDVRIGRVLGKGRTARVHVGQYQEGRVAIKACRHRSRYDSLLHEAMVLATLDHDNVLKMHGLCLDTPLPKLVMTYCERGDLHSYLRLRSAGAVQPKRLKAFAAGVASGMRYLAARSVVHLDLAARNVLLAEAYTPKIADFALAQWPGSGRPLPDTERLPVRWAAPECLRGDDGAYQPAADVWSFGVLLFEIFSRGSRPYDHLTSNEDVREAVVEGTLRLEEPPLGPPAIRSIMYSMCLVPDPTQRSSFSDLHAAITSLQMA
ncbi:TK protein kinase [Salpingoeca rosetta]|uniref:TK protein kinase n=1 Tax=Salpingoeca rosetta (strain ATCC 50818 / BSB-021) TaxID=946362 RepID=F2UBG5_SALR5|nr:TK protein kinase [Salpingoeca rosetta]EGD73831.1 TK protein kinase [Salpingoeca rosetta]|eukprot:XP_004993394.1 TK protein kinase [Salpingoeca rosetta]